LLSEAKRQIAAEFPLQTLDAGEYASFRAAPLHVELEWYRAEGLGNVSFLRGRALGGLMSMQTLVVNPFSRDVPLFSFDWISAMGNQTLLTEYYNTLLRPESFDAGALQPAKELVGALTPYELGARWYDGIRLPQSIAVKAKKSALPQLRAAFYEALGAWLRLAAQSPLLDEAERGQKRERAAAYTNGLLQNGGPSTDAFQKSLGKERTADLFSRIVFGTAEK
jgi:hypothetical protein